MGVALFSAVPGPTLPIQHPSLIQVQGTENIFPAEKQHTLNRSALFFGPALAQKAQRRTFASPKQKTVRSSRG